MGATFKLTERMTARKPGLLSRLPRHRIKGFASAALALAFVLFGLTLAPVLATAVHAADLKAIEEAARKEAPMTWYVSLYSQAVAEKAATAFGQKYPGLKVIPVRSTTGGSFQRLTQDLKSNVAVASVFSTTGLGGHYQILERDGRLAEYVPENAAKLSPTVKSAIVPGYVYPMGAGLLAMAYNSAKVKAEDTPKSWMDLTDPKWKKRLALGHPAFSGFDAAWCVVMMKRVGWKYYEAIAKNDPLVQRSTFDTLTALSSGERVVATLPDAFAIEAAEKGNPVTVVYPTDGSVMILGYTAILKNAPQPNTARLFTEFLLDVEHAKVVADARYVSVRPEVVTILQGGKRLDEIVLAPITPAEETERELPRIIERWRDLFGQ
jgi:iron(III) transport system substrate-binding protein